jgi:quinol monooxygenase YgiN
MVIEIATMKVIPGHEVQLSEACAEGVPLLLAGEACRSVKLTREVASPSRFVALITWDSLEAHERNFMRSDRYEPFAALVVPHLSGPPVVEYFGPEDVR